VIESKKDALLGGVAIAAALLSLVIFFIVERIIFQRIFVNPGDWFLLANRASMVCGLIATVSAIGALTGRRLSRVSKLVMGVAICIGLAVLLYGAWTEFFLYAMKHGSC